MSKKARVLGAVIVSTKSGQSIKGMLIQRALDAIVLRAASLAAVDKDAVTWHSLEGDVVIPMENVDFWQSALPADVLDTLADRAPVAGRVS